MLKHFMVAARFPSANTRLQLHRQIPPSLRAASVIPADALLFLSRLPSFQLLPTAHPVLLPTVCINRKFLETRSLHFAHSAFPISRAISSKVLCWNLEKYYVETFYAGRQVSFRKDSLQLRRQILPFLRAVSIIPAGSLLFLLRLTSFRPLPIAHQALLPTV